LERRAARAPEAATDFASLLKAPTQSGRASSGSSSSSAPCAAVRSACILRVNGEKRKSASPAVLLLPLDSSPGLYQSRLSTLQCYGIVQCGHSCYRAAASPALNALIFGLLRTTSASSLPLEPALALLYGLHSIGTTGAGCEGKRTSTRRGDIKWKLLPLGLRSS